jgi:hypothetical protein
MADPSVTERSYPFSSGPGQYVTEDDWSAMARTFHDNGVFGHPGTTVLKVTPGTTSGTIKIAIGEASIDGFHYRLTAPKVLSTTPNSGSVARTDLVILTLDTVTKALVPSILTSKTVSQTPAGAIPLAEWSQLPDSAVTGTNWGSATDRRWFMGARVRPAIAGAEPPPSPGSMMYHPSEGPQAQMYLGALDGAGTPYWTPWNPWQSDVAVVKQAPVEASDETDTSTTSTSYVPGSPVVSLSFVAPPSGKALITVYARLEGTSPSAAYCSFEVRHTNSTGTVVFSPDDRYAAAMQDQYWSGSERRKLVSGLTPGDTYYVRTMIRTSNGSNAAVVLYRALLAEPVYLDNPPALVGQDEILVLGPTDPVPVGTPAGTVILRTA